MSAANEQLSFDVGVDERPTGSTFRITGSLDEARELYVDDAVRVNVMSADGEIIAGGYGSVVAVGFKRQRPAKREAYVERVHTIKLEDEGE